MARLRSYPSRIQIDVNQWQAAIGTFKSVVISLGVVHNKVRSGSILFPILKLYFFGILFVLITIPLLPLTLTIKAMANFVLSKVTLLAHFCSTIFVYRNYFMYPCNY